MEGHRSWVTTRWPVTEWLTADHLKRVTASQHCFPYKSLWHVHGSVKLRHEENIVPLLAFMVFVCVQGWNLRTEKVSHSRTVYQPAAPPQPLHLYCSAPSHIAICVVSSSPSNITFLLVRVHALLCLAELMDWHQVSRETMAASRQNNSEFNATTVPFFEALFCSRNPKSAPPLTSTFAI